MTVTSTCSAWTNGRFVTLRIFYFPERLNRILKVECSQERNGSAPVCYALHMRMVYDEKGIHARMLFNRLKLTVQLLAQLLCPPLLLLRSSVS